MPRLTLSCSGRYRWAALDAAAPSEAVVIESVGTNQTYTAGGFIGKAWLGVGCSPRHGKARTPGAEPGSVHPPPDKCF